MQIKIIAPGRHGDNVLKFANICISMNALHFSLPAISFEPTIACKSFEKFDISTILPVTRKPYIEKFKASSSILFL
jgi:hypothetical protein